MGGIEAIGSATSGMTAGAISPAGGASGGQTLQAGGLEQSAGQSSVLSLSSTSIQASSETLLMAKSPMLASNEAIGAVLLMLILQYLQTGDAQEKQNLTSMIGALAGMQQQGKGGGGELLFYSSSSLSVESTQMTIATSQGLNAYTGAAASLQQAPAADAGSAGLNVLA